MEGRRVSSLSAGSNESEGSGGARAGDIFLEEIGQLALGEVSSPSALTSQGSLLALLSGDSHLWLAEVKLRPDSAVEPARSALLALPGAKEDGRRYLDCCLLAAGPAGARLALLAERKNKERVVSVVGIVTQGRALALGEELSSYDKVAMLGKGLSHLACGPAEGGAGGEDLFVFGSIVRKLRVEEEGRVIRPTAGRVPIPPECMDGTLAVCVTGTSGKKGASVLCSSRTKSAGKNKFQLNWFQVKKDELSAPSGKAAVKLPEEQEPAALLSDPRDPRALYAVCTNPVQQTSSLHRVARGRRPDEPVHTFPFPVSEAALLAGPDRTLFLLVLEASTNQLRALQLSRAEGYRGQEAVWSRAAELSLGPGPRVQALNCAMAKWQVPGPTADALLSSRAPYQAGLATLLTGGGDIATEPESGLPYRLRLLGADQCNDCLAILLEDLERAWEGEEDTLAGCSLRLALTTSPHREGLSQLSAWLMGGRLAQAEIQVARPERDSCPGGSDRLAILTISQDALRSHLVEQDWTQTALPVREGTFVLDPPSEGGSHGASPSPAAIRSSAPSARAASAAGPRTRIPSAHRRSPGPELTNGGGGEAEEIALAIARVEEAVSPLARASAQIRDSLSLLEKNLGQLRASAGRLEGPHD